jgi:hypothetical protein
LLTAKYFEYLALQSELEETKEKFRHPNFKFGAALTFGYHPKQHDKIAQTIAGIYDLTINVYAACAQDKQDLTRKQNLRLSLTLQRTVTSVHTLTYNKAACDFFRTEEVVIGAEQDTGIENSKIIGNIRFETTWFCRSATFSVKLKYPKF